MRYKSIEDEKKALKYRSKKPVFQKRQIDSVLAQRAAKKLHAKHPDWTNTELASHPQVAKHFDELMTLRSRLRILHEILPGKPGRPTKRQP